MTQPLWWPIVENSVAIVEKEGERVASGGHQYRAVSVIEDYWLLSVMCYVGHFSLAGKVNNY